MGEEASIVRGKGDDVVEKERLKPRELGAERCRTVLYLHTSAFVSIRQHSSAYVSIRRHTSAYVSIRQHTSAYVSIRQNGAIINTGSTCI